MKTFATMLLAALFAVTAVHTSTAQTADEIITNYLDIIGGKEKLNSLNSVKFSALGKAQGFEIPIVMYQKMPGKVRMDMTFQGQEMTQMAFNGEEGWGVNFMTQKSEKWDAEQSAIAKADMTFVDPFVDYKEKGFTISLEGEEDIEGTACHKIKLTKKPLPIDGEEVENYSYYFFDKETTALIMQREFAKTGQMKGQASETYFSDYDEVDGLYFAYTIAQKINGQEMFSMTIDKIELNVDIEDGFFDFPEETPSEEGDKK